MSGGPTDYLTVAEILAIHDDLIERYGGAAGVRDPGQLEAALFRPQTGYYVDVIAQAAALWESLSQNHAFVDGNKRVAFAAMFAFLTINGVTLMATADEAWTFVSALYESGAFRFEALETWLRRNCR
ncbi:type II toxin-antitoxin system death-on-curing family toxin [Methylocystis sp.]|uniref:type II toxin-antitoxin system death-on-curing family toxin n=1 Tax=Methylocystis sp. TaxID=1911079 RepID=UPI003D116760